MFMMPSIIGFYPAENRIYAVLLLIFRFNYMVVALQLPAFSSFLFFAATHTHTTTDRHTQTNKQNNFEKCKKKKSKMTTSHAQHQSVATAARWECARERLRVHLSHFT